MVDLVQTINNHIDKNEYVVMVSFDLSCAFDTLRPAFVSQKISRLGLRGKVCDWLVSFLGDRVSRVGVGGTLSEPYITGLGAPQGSVLGPLIFLLYVNDLPDHISVGELFAYADDTSIIVSDVDPDGVCRKVFKVVDEFKTWCDRNGLMINLDKTVFLKFRSRLHRNSPLSLHILDKPVSFSGSVGFLGVMLDSDLTYEQHIDKTVGKLNSAYFAISSLKCKFGQETLLSVYYGIFFCHLNYCITVWGVSADVKRLFLIQKRVIRLIFNIKFRETCRDAFRRYNILTVTSIYLYKILSFIHSNVNSINKRSDIHNYNTRSSNHLCLSSHNHTYYKHSPMYSGSWLYNMLPASLKNSSDIAKFRSELRRFLYGRAYYSIAEFVGEMGDGTQGAVL